jgi:hypothetical protein
MYDVSFNVHILLCGHYKTIEDNNLKCQTLMGVFIFCMMLVIVYVLCCANIVKQQEIRTLNVKFR